MKEEAKSKPTLIILTGLPGSGKTFFANNFSKAYGVPFLNINKLRSLIVEFPVYDKQETTKVNKICLELLAQMFKTGKTVILETDTSTRTSRNIYSKLAKMNNYNPLIVWVKSLDEEAKYRSTVKNRIKPKDFLISEEIFDKISSKFTVPSSQENYIVISGKHAFKNQYKTVLRTLAKPKPTK